jgi:large-conductance mechanosensitive channel
MVRTSFSPTGVSPGNILKTSTSMVNLNEPDQQFHSFVDFLTDSSMIKFGVALVISLQLKLIVSNITDSILTPIMNRILNSNINKFHVELFDINFQLGEVLGNILSFLVIMFIIYAFIKIFKLQKNFENMENDDDKK